MKIILQPFFCKKTPSKMKSYLRKIVFKNLTKTTTTTTTADFGCYNQK